MQVVSNDAQFDGKSKSLTKLVVQTNLSELILKEDLTRQELEENYHDAEFDFYFIFYALWVPSRNILCPPNRGAGIDSYAWDPLQLGLCFTRRYPLW